MIEKEEEKIDKKYQNPNYDPYKDEKWYQKIPYWIKAIFIRYWFYGAVCFFVGMGLPNMKSIYYILVAGLAGGALFDIACNNILKVLETDKKEAKHFMFLENKSAFTFIGNVCFTLVVYYISAVLSSLIVSTYKDPATNWFLQEPLSQALMLIIIDSAIIWIKNAIVFAFRKK